MYRLCLIIVTGVMLFQSNLALAQAWEKIGQEDGVTSYRRPVAGSKVVAFSGETEINAPIERVLWVIMNNEHRTKWVHRLKVSRVLERKSNYEAIIYQAFKLPIPISNRDYVYHAKVNPKGTGAVVDIRSTTHGSAPKTVGVRAHLSKCQYVLEPRGPSKTFVRVEVHTDPKGLIPSFLVNMIQKNWPLKTLSGIRMMTKKPYAQEIALPQAG